MAERDGEEKPVRAERSAAPVAHRADAVGKLEDQCTRPELDEMRSICGGDLGTLASHPRHAQARRKLRYEPS